MRAVTCREPGATDVLQLSELPDPEPGPGEVLIATVAAGVNRADLMQRIGRYPPPPGVSDIIGLEVSGHVAGVGADVPGWSVGDPCVALLAGGGYAELVVAPAGQVVAPPPSVDLVTVGGVMEVAATVWSNLRVGRLAAGETLLVHGGAGGIGSFAIPYAKALGATVVATAGSEQKLAYCRDLGADLALSYRDDWVAALRQQTDGADVILDNMGGSLLEANVAALAPHGRIVTIGLQGGTKGTLDLGRLLSTWGQVSATSLRYRPVTEKAEICAGVVADVWPRFGTGELRPTRETRIPLAEAARAHTLLESGENTGKVVLTTG